MPIYKLYKRALLRDNRCGTKHSHKKRQLKNKLRPKKQLATGDVLVNSPGMGETRPCRVRAPLTTHLNRDKAVVVATTLVHHIEIKVVEVKLASMTNRWSSMRARARYMQRDRSTQLH